MGDTYGMMDMPMRKRPEQTAQTENDLKQAFWKLYATRPVEQITVSEVAQLAGYNRGTFYLHFQDIYDVLNGIEQDLLQRMSSCVETCMQQLDAGDDPIDCMQGVLDFYTEHREHIVVLLGPHGDPAFTAQLKSLLKPLWRTYVLHKDPEKNEQETDLVLEYTLSGALFMISRWLQNPHGVSPEKLLHLIYHSALHR